MGAAEEIPMGCEVWTLVEVEGRCKIGYAMDYRLVPGIEILSLENLTYARLFQQAVTNKVDPLWYGMHFNKGMQEPKVV